MRERFLLHTCCAPCGIAVIDELRKSYDLTVLFYNPNIHPEAEYLKRKREVVRVCEEWGIPMIDEDYDVAAWDDAVKGLASEPEGGARCGSCFRHRLFHAAKVASGSDFPIFGSTLTSGRTKSATDIDPIGATAAEAFGIRYHDEDWKKCGRQERARTMVRERGIYRQDYCGCRYSLQARRSTRKETTS